MAENQTKPEPAPAPAPAEQPPVTEPQPGAESTSHGLVNESTQHSSTSREPTLAEMTELAAAEGHDADIPSNVGYVLDEAGEEKRRLSIARHRSRAESVGNSEIKRSLEHRDVEKEAGRTTGEGSGGEG